MVFDEELIALTFFDSRVSFDEKRAMLKNFKEKEGKTDPPKRLKLRIGDHEAIRTPSSFVTQRTTLFFDALGLPRGFLNKDPQIWHQDKDFTAARNIVKKLKVINDTAERRVAFIQEFNDQLTRGRSKNNSCSM